jgi:hypothetical protein
VDGGVAVSVLNSIKGANDPLCLTTLVIELITIILQFEDFIMDRALVSD